MLGLGRRRLHTFPEAGPAIHTMQRHGGDVVQSGPFRAAGSTDTTRRGAGGRGGEVGDEHLAERATQGVVSSQIIRARLVDMLSLCSGSCQ
eukprot:1195805-Prorocentrum_minimum.AAC.1